MDHVTIVEAKVDRVIAYAKKIYSLEQWHIYRRVWDDKVETPDEGYSDGYCRPNTKYLMATLDVAGDLDDERLVHVVMHEMAHVLLAEMAIDASKAVDALPKKERKPYRWMLDRGEERVCEMLARGVLSSISVEDIFNGLDATEGLGQPSDEQEYGPADEQL